MSRKPVGPEPTSERASNSATDRDKERSLKLTGKNKIKDQRVRSSAYRRFKQLLQDGRRQPRHSAPAGAGLVVPRPARTFAQRVAVRLTYAKNKGDGTWRAHGTYLERESATGKDDKGCGFGHAGDQMEIAKTLDGWQKSQDERIFKLIISPEHGAKLDLREFTSTYIAQLEKQLGTRLEWVAAAHYNTDNPHVHVAVRGRDDEGRALRIPREFIKGPLRTIAQDLATSRLGYRTEADISEARGNQVAQHRWTDLDRMLTKMGKGGVVDFSKPVAFNASEERKELRYQLLKRLATLEGMGLAAREQGGRWRLDPGAETILRERQKANDRLKVLHSHRAMASDPRLPLAPAPAGEGRVAGRLIGTGLDDGAQRPYMLMETTGGSVIYLYQSPAIEKARREGMQPGDFVVLTQRERVGQDGRTILTQSIRSHGPADAVLTDPKVLRGELRAQLDRTGQMPTPSTWGGWLGRFHGELAAEATKLQQRGIITQQADRFVMAPPATPRAKGRGD